MWKKIFMNVAEFSSMKKIHGDLLHVGNRSSTPKVNGKHNTKVQQLSLKVNGELLSQGNGIAEMIHANVPIYKEVLPGLESWQAAKVASWHNLEGRSIKWFCVVCIDRRGEFFLLLYVSIKFFFPRSKNGHAEMGCQILSRFPLILHDLHHSKINK